VRLWYLLVHGEGVGDGDGERHGGVQGLGARSQVQHIHGGETHATLVEPEAHTERKREKAHESL
jgi:hypothetical protein